MLCCLRDWPEALTRCVRNGGFLVFVTSQDFHWKEGKHRGKQSKPKTFRGIGLFNKVFSIVFHYRLYISHKYISISISLRFLQSLKPTEANETYVLKLLGFPFRKARELHRILLFSHFGSEQNCDALKSF